MSKIVFLSIVFKRRGKYIERDKNTLPWESGGAVAAVV